MCPKPVSTKSDAPALADYNLYIPSTSAIDMSSPYIVSFIRASQEAVQQLVRHARSSSSLSLEGSGLPRVHLTLACPAGLWCNSQAVTIDFRIVDANNLTVVTDTVVTLEKLSNTVPSNCRCTMPTIPTQVAATYGQNYGSQCQAWDNAKCDELWGVLA